MTSVFLCHASEDKPLVEPIQLALASEDYTVFYDENSIPPGVDYQKKIHNAINQCDLFIFIITKSSLLKGKYTLTELKFARDRWPSPVNKILPVNLGAVPTNEIPNYLKSATLMTVHGNAAAEVRVEAKRLLGTNTKKKKKIISLSIAIGSIVLTLSFTFVRLNTINSQEPPLEPDKKVEAGRVLHNQYCAKCHDDEIYILNSLGRDISDYVQYDRMVEDRFIGLFNNKIEMPKKELKIHKKMLDEQGIKGVYTLLEYYKYKAGKKKKDGNLDEIIRYYGRQK